MIFQELATISDPPHKEGSRGAFATKSKFDKMLKTAMQRASRMPFKQPPQPPPKKKKVINGWLCSSSSRNMQNIEIK